jgi:serine/threonine protein kinase
VVNTGRTCQLWQAYHDGTSKFVAVKALLGEFKKNREYLGYLKWEYQVAGKIVDDRIIRILEFGVDCGVPYLAMEWFSAPNLKQWIRRGTEVTAPMAPKIILEASEAVAHFNSFGWVHRDIKPDNFLVKEDGSLKLIDFAIACRAKGPLARPFSRKSKVQGTRSYMSPEQIRGDAVDARADLYSLACTFFELLSGKPPFTGDTAKDLLSKHLNQSPPSLRAYNSNVTEDFSELLRRSMAKKPSDRPKSVEDFLQEVRKMRIYQRPAYPPAATRPSEK